MNTVILDTNALRSTSPSDFQRLVDAERAHGIRQYADLWTIAELVSHLDRADDPSYWPSRRALRRCILRALSPGHLPPRVVMPAEIQLSRLIFGKTADIEEASVTSQIELARMICEAEDSDGLQRLLPAIRVIAAHVEDKEKWFEEYFTAFRRHTLGAVEGVSVKEQREVIRAHTRSDELRRQDAIAAIERTFDTQGATIPQPIPEQLIDSVKSMMNTSTQAVGIILERILCDNASLHKSNIRNLLWDQEVAGSIGQIVDDLPVIVVTDDRFFAEAARRSGHADAVRTLSEYSELLGVTIEVAGAD